MDARALARLSALALTLAACGNPSPSAPQIQEHMIVTSTGVGTDAFIGVRHTCDGADDPLPLAISGTPEGAKTLGVTMQDRDAGGFVHWVLLNLKAPPPSATVDLEVDRASPVENDFGRPGYGGPCPPPGGGPHEYEIKVHAFPTSVRPELERDELLDEIERARIDGGTLIGLYERKQ